MPDMVVPPCLIDQENLQERVRWKSEFGVCASRGDSGLKTVTRLHEERQLWQEKNAPTGP